MPSANQIIVPALQALGFFVSLILLGYGFGHERAVQEELHKLPGFDKTKAPWLQPELYAKAKFCARAHFPCYWYFGNIIAAAILCTVACITDLADDFYLCLPAEISCCIVAVICSLMYTRTKETPSD